MKQLGMAVRWSDQPGSIARIRKLGGVPVVGRPRHVNPKRGPVAIVQAGGIVRYLFEADGIVGPEPVTLADGTPRVNGYFIRARKGSIHSPAEGEVKRLRIKWYAIGQFRYFDPHSGAAVLVSDSVGDGDHLEDDLGCWSSPHIRPYAGGIPGKDRGNPEAQLVDAYVTWIGRPERFGHIYLRSPKLHTDLFDRSCWRLIEAKAATDRHTLRTAVGQLFDYKRFFPRKPSSGVLLPERPRDSDLEFIRDCRIIAVWRTNRGGFLDSTEDRRWSTNDISRART